MRKDKPGAFCAIISGGLLSVAIAGHLISGCWLVLGILIGVFVLCAKYQVRLINGEPGEYSQALMKPRIVQQPRRFLGNVILVYSAVGWKVAE